MLSQANQVYEQAHRRTLPVRVTESHGKLIYQTCPHCGADINYCLRERNYSHERQGFCTPCNWRCWESEMESDMARHYSPVATAEGRAS